MSILISRSLKEVRRYIIEKRKMNDISSKEARFYWTRSDRSNEAVCELFRDTNKSLLDLYDNALAILIITKQSHSLTYFMEKIWPVFIEKLISEVAWPQ